MISIRHGLLALSVLASACRTSAPGGAPGPDPGGPSPASIDRPSADVSIWNISPVNQEHSYTSVTSAVLESTGPLPLSRDTVTSTVNFSLSLSRDTSPPAYSARIESISIRGGSRTRDPASVSDSLLPFAFTGRVDSTRITIDPLKSQADLVSGCTSEVTAVIPIIQRSLVFVPLQLHKGLTWTDSLVTTVCSGPLQTALSSIRTYLVKGQTALHGRPVILLEQQNRTSFTGEGTQQQHRVRVHGNGSGTAQIAVDAETGILIETAADHVTTLTVTSSGRDQTFTQTSRERVTLTK